MKFRYPIDINSLASQYDCEVYSEKSEPYIATGINEINRVTAGDLCFVDHEKYYKKAIKSKAVYIIINKKITCPKNKVLLINKNPFAVYNQIAFDQYQIQEKSNHISSRAKIAENVVIGKNVKIGPHTIIESGVTIHDDTTIGKNVKIQSGSQVGSDAFYYHTKPNGAMVKWHSCDVDIASLCTINKGVSSSTIIGKGTKIDCHVHIGHGVQIGKHCLIAAQVGISGKTIIGDQVKIYGQVGITQNLHIEDNVIIYAQSGVNNNLKMGKIYFGSPALEIDDKIKEIRALRRLANKDKDK